MTWSKTFLLGACLLLALPARAQDQSNCADSMDNDGDGWVDKLDPDCQSTGVESGFGTATCNNGQDDDRDGLVDAKDAKNCTSGYDEESGNCGDGGDNDGDGWVDKEDPDCQIECFTEPCYASELGYGKTTCNDGRDNDGDGAVDRADSDCSSAWAEEGVGTDSYCSDGVDNDGDGWADKLDPDCGVGPNEVGFGTATCNDGQDNDHDGLVDAKDSGSCLSGYEEEKGDCDDTKDNDGDGWIDLEDPDCPAYDDGGSPYAYSELGFGTGVCNDGIDNDGDNRTDADDPGCVNSADENEATGCGARGSSSRPLPTLLLFLLPLSILQAGRRRQRRI